MPPSESSKTTNQRAKLALFPLTHPFIFKLPYMVGGLTSCNLGRTDLSIVRDMVFGVQLIFFLPNSF